MNISIFIGFIFYFGSIKVKEKRDKRQESAFELGVMGKGLRVVLNFGSLDLGS